MGRKRLRVVHKPAGYVAYKDEIPIRRMNLRAVLVIFAIVFGLGSVATLTVSALMGNSQSATVAGQLVTPPAETTAEAIIPSATITPTIAPTQTATNTPTITPTPIAHLKLTVDALSARLDAMRQATPQVVTVTPAPTIAEATEPPTQPPTATPAYEGYAVVLVDCAVIRAGAGRHTRALGSACRGARYPVLDIYNEWVQIAYQGFDSAWIAMHLVRIEP